jgi:two-component system response regulator RegA
MAEADTSHMSIPLGDAPALLLVDDDRAFCMVLSEALARRGFQVAVAHDLEQAKALCDQHQPEYAVVDLRIGNESGLELVSHLVAMDENTRIVMLTGYASVATAVEAIKLGATHYLTKPADAKEIVAALAREEGDASVPPAEKPLSVRRLEWEHLQKILLAHHGNISAAARALKMHRRTLQRKLAKHPVRE